ncbi:hypothetical protein [Falsiroseomonas oryziterrae]|uniref:hypothetical protein n=1 Tax=Falsiroseomonas oryziterrae TaxID=2911368 RepID=UPI001F3A28F9|nr:hypothetical protein [Roseomonas sp. NPKOSM-4]
MLALAPWLPGCVVVPETPLPSEEPAAPIPEIGTLAAYATVRAVDARSRIVMLTTSSGGMLDMTLQDGRNLGRLRPGMPVIAEYDATGRARIASTDIDGQRVAPNRIRGVLVEVQRGGEYLVVAGQERVPLTVAVPSPAMMAFATRLGPGDDIAVSFLSP